jgi:hypothetical protein
MKKRPLLFVAFSVIIATVAFQLTEDNSKKYSPRNSKMLVEGYEDAAAYFEALRANPETGEMDYALYRSVKEKDKAYRAEKGESSIGLEWQEVGPDNIGGRTRALLIAEDGTMFAGSTTGGLFKSINNGNTWDRVISFNVGFGISSIAQLGNGHIYIGTGSSAELRSSSNSGFGNGLFVSTDNGETWDYALDGNGDPIKPSSIGGGAYSVIDALEADPNVANKLWVGSNEGLEPYVEGQGFLPKPDGLPTTGGCQSISISGDGSVIAASVSSNNFYLSTDGGVTFEDRAGNGENEIPSNATRLVVAVSPDNPNFIYGAIADGSPGSFGGVYGSNNGGETFELVWNGDVASISPDRENNAFPVAWYGLAIEVVPESPGLFLLGCLDVWIGGFSSQPEQRSFWQAQEFGYGTFPLDGTPYVHADICTFTFDDNGDVYIGTDGGVFRSEDGANSFTSVNRFYNVTQYYGIGMSGNDKVLGGSQDNGSTYITKAQSTTQEALKVGGGDGILCDVSSLNPDGNILFTSVPNNFVSRSNDGGTLSMTPMITFAMASQPAPFRSVLKLWESADANTPYTVDFVNNSEDDVVAGTELTINSRVDGYTFDYTLTETVAPGDTALIPDPATSLFAIGYSGSGGIYLTRDATYFDSFPSWAKIKGYVLGTVTSFEFSKDGEYLWVSSANTTNGVTYTSRVYRISGFNNAWSVNELQYDSPDYALTIDSITMGGSYVSDISVDPNDNDHVIISKAGFGGSAKVMESTNATSASVSFTDVWFDSSNELSDLPVYTCLIEASDPNIFIVGTEFGVYATDNGGADWSPESSGPLTDVIVYDIRQQNMDPELVTNAGYIYLGTFGRGAFRSTTYEKNLIQTGGIAQANNELVEDFVISPNPMNEFGWLSFNASEKASVNMEVYTLNGQKVKELTFIMTEGANHIQFNVHDLSEGSYIVRLQKDNRVTTDKFVIIR